MAKHPHHGRMKHFNRYFAMIARQPQLNVHHDCHQMDPQATVSSAGTVKDQISNGRVIGAGVCDPNSGSKIICAHYKYKYRRGAS